jgi:heme-degrading monooxygenase HmoA
MMPISETAEMMTTGTWIVEGVKQPAFLEAWAAFAAWASSMDGAGTLRLGRDSRDPDRFVSYGPWDSGAQAHAWKANAEFRERMAHVMQHVDEFYATELEVVGSATDGRQALSVSVTNQ